MQRFAVPDDLAEMVETYRPKILRFAYAYLRDRDAAETVAQDCLLRAHGAFSSFRGDCSVQTWLLGIAVNLIRDYSRNPGLRFWKRSLSTPLPDFERLALRSSQAANDSPEQMALVKERVSFVWAAAERLPRRQRSIFWLRFAQDLDILEIAAVTGTSEGTVKKHLSRALQTIRLRLAGK